MTALPPILLELPSDEQRQIGQLVLDDLNIPLDEFAIMHLQPVRWNHDTLDCTETIRSTGGTPGYQVYVSTDETIYVYHTNLQGGVQACGETDRYELAQDVLLKLDPVAAEMVAVAQSRIAEQYIVSTTDVVLADVTPIIWEDGSLGCPERGVTYPTADVEGYRIVVELDNRAFIFHADDRTLIPCAPEDEVLPEATTEPG